jgi:hypothetical protein
VRIIALLLLIAGTSLAQVENAADADAGVSAFSAVAPSSQAFVSDSFAGTPPSVNGAAVSIRPVGSSTPIPAEVLGARSTGITFLIPPDTPLGNAQLIYSQVGQLTQSTSIAIVSNNLALYRGSMKAMNINASGSATPNGMANPAQPGENVEIFATGLSMIPQSPPLVNLGGVTQSVVHAGSGATAGLLKIDIQISPDTPDGCYVPLTVTWGPGTASATISKTSDGMACHHPFGLSPQILQTLDSGGSLESGVISMTTALTAASADRASRSEQVVVSFTDFSAAQIANYFGAGQGWGCNASSSSVPTAIFDIFGGVPFGNTMTLQSGATTLTLPSNGGPEYSISIPPTADAPLNHLPAPVIGTDTWTWSFSVGQFAFNLPAPLQVSGGAPIRIQTDRSETITWDGSGFDSTAIFQLSLSAVNFGPPSITCFAPAQSGTLTIPSNLTAPFSPGGVGMLTASVVESGGGIPHANFQLSDGTPLLMLVSRGSTDTRPVDFQ